MKKASKLLIKRLCLYSFIRKSLILFFLIVFIESNTAQNSSPNVVNVTGKVTDSKNEPLLGVNIRVKGFTVLGTVTDINGRFLLRISENI